LFSFEKSLEKNRREEIGYCSRRFRAVAKGVKIPGIIDAEQIHGERDSINEREEGVAS